MSVDESISLCVCVQDVAMLVTKGIDTDQGMLPHKVRVTATINDESQVDRAGMHLQAIQAANGVAGTVSKIGSQVGVSSVSRATDGFLGRRDCR